MSTGRSQQTKLTAPDLYAAITEARGSLTVTDPPPKARETYRRAIHDLITGTLLRPQRRLRYTGRDQRDLVMTIVNVNDEPRPLDSPTCGPARPRSTRRSRRSRRQRQIRPVHSIHWAVWRHRGSARCPEQTSTRRVRGRKRRILEGSKDATLHQYERLELRGGLSARTGSQSRNQGPDSRRHARPIYQVHLFVVGAGCRDVIRVKVPGEPKGIGEFTPVKLAELVATRCHGRQGGH